jgi:hypothetical protein
MEITSDLTTKETRRVFDFTFVGDVILPVTLKDADYVNMTPDGWVHFTLREEPKGEIHVSMAHCLYFSQREFEVSVPVKGSPTRQPDPKTS